MLAKKGRAFQEEYGTVLTNSCPPQIQIIVDVRQFLPEGDDIYMRFLVSTAHVFG